MEPLVKPVVSMSDATIDRYLAAILLLSRRAPVVRSVDVAAFLGCSKACVSVALKHMQHAQEISLWGMTFAGKSAALMILIPSCWYSGWKIREITNLCYWEN